MKDMTFEEKLKKYNAGLYLCAVPPVVHVRWSTQDWIRWIDKEGKWLDSIKINEEKDEP